MRLPWLKRLQLRFTKAPTRKPDELIHWASAARAAIVPAMDDKSKPPVVDLTAELGVVRMRSMVGPSAEEAYRPRMCLWVDQQSGAILSFELFKPSEHYSPQILKSFSKLSKTIGGVPRQVQLRDPGLATELRVSLDPMGIETVVRESLPELDKAARNLMDVGLPRAGTDGRAGHDAGPR
jgi:hypothetical protein